MKTLASPMPVMAAVFAVAVLSTMDAAIKAVSVAHPTGQVVFLRYLAGFAALALVSLLPRAGRPTLGTFQRAAVRALFILATAFLFFKTLTLLPLAEAVAVSFTAPFFMVFAARILLKEAVPRSAWVAISIGFSGVLVMLAGRLQAGEALGGDPVGYVTGIACSVTYAIAMVMTRKDSGHDPVLALVLAQNATAALYSLPLAVFVWTPPTEATVLLFVAIGALGTAGHLAFAWAYAHAPTARLAPIEYTGFLWAGVFGVVFFGEFPTVWTFLGAALIVGACLMVFRKTG
ncbi:DMT family transporter [Chthonobacter rhizosphaerae]|uniref:DMT family transporter n=1 Tax=Chthonobacter rhizosphaerae TaxID=2735553 RepID=UPI0015EF5BD5|nr:DMT family transporter [Chthonobacter rhizosphaerae]